MDHLEKEKQAILDYKLHKCQDYTRILIQLFGSAGHGKSSLINSFFYALHEEKFHATAQVQIDGGHNSQGGLTTIRSSYQLTDVITVVDNRGFGKMDDYETWEICAQLANVLNLDEKVDFEVDTFYKSLERVVGVEINYTDLLVPVFVYSVPAGVGKDMENDISQLLEKANTLTSLAPIVVLTRKNSRGYKNVETFFKNIGIEYVIGVENYTPQDHVKTEEKDKQFLRILQNVLELIEFSTEDGKFCDPQKRHKERLKMLLEMAHERETEKARREERGKKPPGGCNLL